MLVALVPGPFTWHNDVLTYVSQVSIVPPYDAASCSQLATNAKLFDRVQKVVRHLVLLLVTPSLLHS